MNEITINGHTVREFYPGEFDALLADGEVNLSDFAAPEFEVTRRRSSWERFLNIEGSESESPESCRFCLDFLRAAAVKVGLPELKDAASVKAAWAAVAADCGASIELDPGCCNPWHDLLAHALAALDLNGDPWKRLAFVYGQGQADKWKAESEAEERKARAELTPPQFERWRETGEWPAASSGDDDDRCEGCPFAAAPLRVKPGPGKAAESVLRAWRQHGELGRCTGGETKLFAFIVQAANAKTRSYLPPGGRRQMGKALHVSPATVGRWLLGLVKRGMIVRKSWRRPNRRGETRMGLALYWQWPAKPEGGTGKLYPEPEAQK